MYHKINNAKYLICCGGLFGIGLRLPAVAPADHGPDFRKA